MKTNSTPFLSNKIYHVYHRGVNGENIFKEERNYIYFLKKFTQYISPIAEIYAYCLLKNHFHFLLKIKPLENISLQKGVPIDIFLSKQFSNFLNAYTKSINKTYNRHGKLYSGALKRKIVENEHYFLRLLAYIHLNPVHHGFCDTPEEYKYSSFWAYLLPDKKSNINRIQAYSLLKTKDDFLNFHQEILIENDFDDVLEF